MPTPNSCATFCEYVVVLQQINSTVVLRTERGHEGICREELYGVQAALDVVMEGRTCVVVAHRLTTVRAAHKIAVVQRGVVVEEGTHEELVQRNSAYAQLNRAQSGSQ